MNWILGTAQFGLGYGVNGRAEPIDDDALESLLDFAWASGIQMLDTAPAYGDAESRIGKIQVHPFKIVSKLAPFPAGLPSSAVEKFAMDCIESTLARLRVPVLEGLLVHREQDLLGPYGRELAATLAKVERLGLARMTGVSVYHGKTIDALLAQSASSWRPKLVQVPSNPFDRRLIRGGQIERLRSAGVWIVGRSIFLQGLLLMAPNQIPKPLESYAPHLEHWQNDASMRHGSPHRAALAYALNAGQLDAAVIGVDDESQLRELVAAAPVAQSLGDVDRWAVDDARLVDPSMWEVGQ